jgi:hypothetical protein
MLMRSCLGAARNSHCSADFERIRRPALRLTCSRRTRRTCDISGIHTAARSQSFLFTALHSCF